jgi:hypothetical protein
MTQNAKFHFIILVNENSANPASAKNEFGHFQAGATICAVAHALPPVLLASCC